MLPKSSKHFIQPTAEKLDYDTTLVEDVIGFFYEDVRRVLVEMRGPNIQIENLGSFKAIPRKVPGLIQKYKDHLDTLNPNEFSQKGIIINVEQRLDKVLKLKKIIDEESARRKAHVKKKDEYRRKNMGKPKQDS